MAFYNRLGPRTNVDIAGAHPLDVVTYGGLFYVAATTAGTAAMLAAAPAGFAYKLHRWGLKPISPALTGGFQIVDGASQLLDGDVPRTSGTLSAYNQNLEGQLVSSGVSVNNLLSGSATFWLRYDVVVFPVIT